MELVANLHNVFKQKTLKIDSVKNTKLVMKLKYYEIDFQYYNNKEKTNGRLICLGMGVDNIELITHTLKEDGISKHSIDTIITFLSTHYNFNAIKNLSI